MVRVVVWVWVAGTVSSDTNWTVLGAAPDVPVSWQPLCLWATKASKLLNCCLQMPQMWMSGVSSTKTVVPPGTPGDRGESQINFRQLEMETQTRPTVRETGMVAGVASCWPSIYSTPLFLHTEPQCHPSSNIPTQVMLLITPCGGTSGISCRKVLPCTSRRLPCASEDHLLSQGKRNCTSQSLWEPVLPLFQPSPPSWEPLAWIIWLMTYLGIPPAQCWRSFREKHDQEGADMVGTVHLSLQPWMQVWCQVLLQPCCNMR